MAEEQTQKTNRDILAERLRIRYPDKEFADDEAMYGQANADYEEYENQLNGYRESERKLTEMMDKYPRSAQFIADMANGNDPLIAIIKCVGSDGVIELINDPAKQEAYAESNKEYAERVAESKRLEEEFNKNLAESMKIREEMDAQYGEEIVDKAIAQLDKWTKDAIVGKMTKEAVEAAIKVMNREADLANARSEGEIAGRNAKIEEHVRKPQGGDGMPMMGGANAEVRNNTRPQSIFDVAAGAN